MRRLTLCLVLVWLAPAALLAHKYHTSLTELGYNAQSGNFEIVLRLFADDLELAISKGLTKRIKLEDPQAEDRILAYMHEVLLLRHGDRTLTFRMVGVEPEVDIVWVYLEAPLNADPAEVTLLNQVFFELHGKQVNTVNVRPYDGKRPGKPWNDPNPMYSLVFESGQTAFQPLKPPIPAADSAGQDKQGEQDEQR